MAVEPAPTSFTNATISIYQNPDHVAGLLQQMWVAPLLTSETHEQGSDNSTAAASSREGGGGLKSGANLPLLGKVEADLAGKGRQSRDTSTGQSARSIRNYEYSQAYYLAIIRDALRREGVLKRINNVTDAESLASGDFVEYKATFHADEISALLDILTPDLIAAITDANVRRQGLAVWDNYESDYEGLKLHVEKTEAKRVMMSSLARSIAEAVRVDFRSEKTREFYGLIGGPDDDATDESVNDADGVDTDQATGNRRDGDFVRDLVVPNSSVTAITICDNLHFVVDDEDRILDGEFTVLGKVTSALTHDVPVLERNKILDRLNPLGVDQMFDQLRNTVDTSTRNAAERRANDDFDLPADFFDLAIASRITGPSFKVIPIAIYT